MEDGVWDLSSIPEEEFDNLAVYLVPDQPCDDTSLSTSRAEASLPRNLVLKPSQTLSDVSIEATRKQKVVACLFTHYATQSSVFANLFNF